MAILTGNNGVLRLDATVGGSVATIAAVRSFSIELTRDTIETTTMSGTSDSRTYLTGLSTWSGSADIYFDDAASTGHLAVHTVLNPTTGTVGQGTLTFQGFLVDTSSKFEGEVIITGFTINSSMDGMVEASISFQGSGPCTFTA
jgi:predicted secreted protein